MTSPSFQALEKFSICDIADALVKLGDPNGGFIPGITLFSPKDKDDQIKIVGPAYTVRFKYLSEADDAPRPTEHFVDTAPPGSIVFISCPDDMQNAVWGGVTTVRAQRREIKGTIINGRARDIQEIRQQQYPIFARGLSTTTPAPIAYVSDVNEKIEFNRGGIQVVVRPEDILIADANGVICLPKGLVEKAIELTVSIAETEQLIEQEIRSGKSFTEASKHRSRVGHNRTV